MLKISISDEIKNKKILIVDDVPSMVSIMKAFLKDVGFFRLATANGGKEALKKMGQTQFDLVICDWNMPGLSGLEILKTMKASEKLQSSAFMMVTASSEVEKVKEAVENGIDGFIVKPFQANVLYEKIISILE